MTRVESQSRIPSSAYKVVAFTVVTVLLLGLLGTLIGNISLTDSRSFRALFSDATGVSAGDRVRLSGVEVGRVTGTRLVRRGDRQLAELTFTVQHEVPIFRSAKLVLRYENIVGQRYLAIEESPGGRAMATDATFPLAQTTPALNLTVLFNGFQPLFRALEPKQVNRLSYLIVQALQGQSSTYASLLRSTASFTNTLADRDEVIGRVVRNLGDVLGTVNERDTELSRLIITFRDLMSGLARNRDTISASLPGLADLLDGTAGYVGAVRGPLKGDVAQLSDLAGHLDKDHTVLQTSLNRMPKRLRAMARTGSYGSYFNFYVCGLQLNLRLLGGDYLLRSPALSANERDTTCGGGPR